jgi:hypothetical protein
MDPEVVVNRVNLVSNSFRSFVHWSILLKHHSTTFPILDGWTELRSPGRDSNYTCQSNKFALLMTLSHHYLFLGDTFPTKLRRYPDGDGGDHGLSHRKLAGQFFCEFPK